MTIVKKKKNIKKHLYNSVGGAGGPKISSEFTSPKQKWSIKRAIKLPFEAPKSIGKGILEASKHLINPNKALRRIVTGVVKFVPNVASTIYSTISAGRAKTKYIQKIANSITKNKIGTTNKFDSTGQGPKSKSVGYSDSEKNLIANVARKMSKIRSFQGATKKTMDAFEVDDIIKKITGNKTKYTGIDKNSIRNYFKIEGKEGSEGKYSSNKLIKQTDINQKKRENDNTDLQKYRKKVEYRKKQKAAKSGTEYTAPIYNNASQKYNKQIGTQIKNKKTLTSQMLNATGISSGVTVVKKTFNPLLQTLGIDSKEFSTNTGYTKYKEEHKDNISKGYTKIKKNLINGTTNFVKSGFLLNPIYKLTKGLISMPLPKNKNINQTQFNSKKSYSKRFKHWYSDRESLASNISKVKTKLGVVSSKSLIDSYANSDPRQKKHTLKKITDRLTSLSKGETMLSRTIDTDDLIKLLNTNENDGIASELRKTPKGISLLENAIQEHQLSMNRKSSSNPDTLYDNFNIAKEKFKNNLETNKAIAEKNAKANIAASSTNLLKQSRQVKANSTIDVNTQKLIILRLEKHFEDGNYPIESIIKLKDSSAPENIHNNLISDFAQKKTKLINSEMEKYKKEGNSKKVIDLHAQKITLHANIYGIDNTVDKIFENYQNGIIKKEYFDNAEFKKSIDTIKQIYDANNKKQNGTTTKIIYSNLVNKRVNALIDDNPVEAIEAYKKLTDPAATRVQSKINVVPVVPVVPVVSLENTKTAVTSIPNANVKAPVLTNPGANAPVIVNTVLAKKNEEPQYLELTDIDLNDPNIIHSLPPLITE